MSGTKGKPADVFKKHAEKFVQRIADYHSLSPDEKRIWKQQKEAEKSKRG